MFCGRVRHAFSSIRNRQDGKSLEYLREEGTIVPYVRLFISYVHPARAGGTGVYRASLLDRLGFGAEMKRK
jgi:hypothetical protein